MNGKEVVPSEPRIIPAHIAEGLESVRLKKMLSGQPVKKIRIIGRDPNFRKYY